MSLAILVIVLVLAIYYSNKALKWANKTEWIKEKENHTEIIYRDSKNNENPKSSHSNGWKFVQK